MASTSSARVEAELPLPLFRLLVLVGCLLLLVLLCVVTYPFLTDYLLHMGRAAIHLRLAQGIDQQFYEAHWDPLPNLAFDLIVPTLGRWMPLELAGKIFVGLTAILEATGGCALVLAVQKRRTPIALLPFLLTFNNVFEWGFLAFLFTLGLSLWAAAGWIWTREGPFRYRWPFLLVPVFLFFGHLAALGVYVVFVLMVELSDYKTDLRRVRANAAMFGASLLPPLAIELAFRAVDESQGTAWGLLKDKVVDLLRSPGMAVTRHGGEIIGYILFASLVLAIAAKWLRFNKTGSFMVVGITCIYLFLPVTLLGSAYAAARLVAVILLALPASLTMSKGGGSRGLACGIFSVLALYVGVTSWRWHSWEPANQDLLRAARFVPVGSMIVPMEVDRDPWTPPRLWHGEEAILLQRDVFEPMTILEPGQQPMRFSELGEKMRGEIQRDLLGESPDTSFDLVKCQANAGRHLQHLAREFRISQGGEGQRGQTYVLLRRQGLISNPMPGVLQPEYEGQWYSLYKVTDSIDISRQGFNASGIAQMPPRT